MGGQAARGTELAYTCDCLGVNEHSMDNLPPPAPLDYAMKGSGPFPLWRAARLIAIWTIGPVLLMLPMVFVVPLFAKVFRDFATQLPFPTAALIASSNWLVQFGLIFLLVALGGSSIVAVLLGLSSEGERRLRSVIAASYVFFYSLLIFEVLFLAIALMAPMTTLIQSVPGK